MCALVGGGVGGCVFGHVKLEDKWMSQSVTF